MPASRRRVRASTKSTSRSPDTHRRLSTRLFVVVLLFEIMLVAAVVVITWFALYAVYRLITDDL